MFLVRLLKIKEDEGLNFIFYWKYKWSLICPISRLLSLILAYIILAYRLIIEKKEAALFILLFWEANPFKFGDHKHFRNASNKKWEVFHDLN